jgi:hypothetical protein
MHKFPIAQYNRFAELPLERFNEFSFNVYILDLSWNFLFVNNNATRGLGPRGKDLVGRNMWEEFPELTFDPGFKELKAGLEKGKLVTVKTISPITGNNLHITGYPLTDCYYCNSSVIPDKDELIQELRNIIKRDRPGGGNAPV